MLKKLVATACLVALLSGCAQPIVQKTGPLSITRVDLSAAPTLKSDTDILSLARQTVPAQLVATHQGKPAVLDLTVNDVHYKNPLASLLVGDANRLSAIGVLRAPEGTEIARFNTIAIDQAAINGIAGAVVSAAQDRARVDRALARGLASSLERQIYGKVSRQPTTPELAAKTSPAPAASIAPAPSKAASGAKAVGAGV